MPVAGSITGGSGLGGTGVGLTLTGDWDLMSKTLGGFTGILAREMERASTLIGIEVRDKIRTEIDAKKYERNSMGTMILKGAGKPLVGLTETGAALLKSLAHQVIDPFTVIVGVNRFASWKGRKNIGRIVHDGTTINVTKKMRAYFRYLAWKHKGFRPLHPRTTKIVIPPRPFIKTVIDDPAVQASVKKHWEVGVARAFAGGRAGA